MLFYKLIINYQKKYPENNLIYNHIRKNKIPKNKLNQKLKDLYAKNYKTLMKEIEKTTNI